MAVVTFDTLKFSDTLKAAGVPPQQAEGTARAFAEVVQLNFKELVTKDDLAHGLTEVEQRLTAKIDASAAKLDAKIDASAAKLDAKIDASVIKMEGQLIHLRWMATAGLTMGFAILVRLFFFR